MLRGMGHAKTVAAKQGFRTNSMSSQIRQAREAYQSANLAWWSARRAGMSTDIWSVARAAAWGQLVSLGALETL